MKRIEAETIIVEIMQERPVDKEKKAEALLLAVSDMHKMEAIEKITKT